MKKSVTIFLKHSKTQFDVDDLSDDEVAKLHIRYLIGGHADLENERLFRVEFPERPGALLMFLERLGPTHNITLFHYRNHGAGGRSCPCWFRGK